MKYLCENILNYIVLNSGTGVVSNMGEGNKDCGGDVEWKCSGMEERGGEGGGWGGEEDRDTDMFRDADAYAAEEDSVWRDNDSG